LTSHVPHLTASALCNLLSEDETREPDILNLIGPGFRDATRIALGDPVLWRDICLDNTDPILAGLDRLMEHLGRLREAVDSGQSDAIEALRRSGQRLRDKAGSKTHDIE
jgi:prephenate dehydrogenase